MAKPINIPRTTLAELVGRQTMALIPWIDPLHPVDIEVHGVEISGLWLESQLLTDKVLRGSNLILSDQTPIFFCPWTEIRFVAGICERAVTQSMNIPKEELQ